MTKTEKIAHLTKQLNEWTAMLHKSRKHSLMCMRATHVSYLQNELAKLKESWEKNLTRRKKLSYYSYNIKIKTMTKETKINLAKREIQIFLNASERIKDMGLEKVSVEYLQEALQCILKKLNK